MQAYFDYNREELLRSPKLKLEILPENKDVFSVMAREMADEILRHNAARERTVFICPVGPVGQYPYFVETVNRERISLKNTWFINMDEYLTDGDRQWLPKSHRLSFRGFMEREVYGKLDPELVMPECQRVFPDPEDCERVPRLLEALDGVDIAFGGVGITGHIAFNEPQAGLPPEAFLQLPTRVLQIAPETRAVNAIGDLNGAVAAMPHWCVTVGMQEIFSARKIRLGCFRDWHRAVVRQACYGEQSAGFPVTLLQSHPDVLLRITEFVASLPE